MTFSGKQNPNWKTPFFGDFGLYEMLMETNPPPPGTSN